MECPAPLVNSVFLGTGPQGHTYWKGSDHCEKGQDYVWQFKPDGTFNGWICTVGAWFDDRYATFGNFRKAIIVSSDDAVMENQSRKASLVKSILRQLK